MFFVSRVFHRIQNLIVRLILPNSSLKMGKLDMPHEEMLVMLARQHERNRTATKVAREKWLRDHAGAEPQEVDSNVRQLIRHDAVVRSK